MQCPCAVSAAAVPALSQPRCSTPSCRVTVMSWAKSAAYPHICMVTAVATLQLTMLLLLSQAAPEGVRSPGTALTRILQAARSDHLVCLQYTAIHSPLI
jgi:hypothetical protein